MSEWIGRALCHPSGRWCDLPWTAESVTRKELALMVTVCASCPVRQDCTVERNSVEPVVRQGTWAGQSDNQRVGINTFGRREPSLPCVCGFCGKEFLATLRTRKWCSSPCGEAGRRAA